MMFSELPTAVGSSQAPTAVDNSYFFHLSSPLAGDRFT